MAYFIYTYGYNDTPQRAERRPDHMEHLAKLEGEGAVVAAGPLADLTGGIIVFKAEDEVTARALVDADPYTQLDVTKDRELQEWKITVGPFA